MPLMIPFIFLFLRQFKSKADVDQINENFNTSQQNVVESAEVAPPYHFSLDQMIQAQGGLLAKIKLLKLLLIAPSDRLQYKH